MPCPRLTSTRPGPAWTGGRTRLLLTALLILLFSSLSWGREIPPFKGYVNDYAGMISPGRAASLENTLLAFDRSDSTQIAVLTIDSLEGEPLEDFSIRVADSWKIGQKNKDNGALLLVAKQERAIRIEAGYGLEGVLTDLLAGRIIDTVISPRFSAGDLDDGFESGVTAIMQAVKGEFTADSSPRHTRQEPPPLLTYLFFTSLLVALLGSSSKGLGILTGTVLLPAAVFMGLPFSWGWLPLLLLLPAGALAGLLLPLLLAGILHARASSPMAGGFYGGRLGHGGFGGGLGGGGFGGFGGGGFGGGGASGGW